MIHPHDVFSRQEPWTTRIRNIALEFTKKSHQVRIIYFPLEYQSHRARFYSEGIEFIPLSRRAGFFPFFHNIRSFLQEGSWAEVIHFQKCFYHAALPAIIAAYMLGKPLHYDWDDWEIKIFHYSARQPVLISVFLSVLERCIPLLCDSVSVASMRLREECVHLGVNPRRIVMAPVGADLELFHPAVSGIRIREEYGLSGPMVSYLGQLHGGQYAEQFIRAAKIVLNHLPRVTFMVIGGGYRLEELKKLARDLNVSGQLIFTGAVAHRKAPLYLAAADVAVACFEDNDITRCKSPLKIAEYLASGKPIVASDVGEVKRMLGGAGVIAPAGDPEALAQGIIKILNDEPLRKRLALKARQRAENIYNWKNTAENLLAAYCLSSGESSKEASA